MEEIEFHISVNADVVIPEWLRRKMGLTDETKETVPDSDETTALEEELHRLEDAIRRVNSSHYGTTIWRNVNRSEDRG